MKTKNILAAFTLLAASLCPTMAQAQSDEAKMNSFIDNLMNKMTLKEKLGQLNLPVTGDIVTGQAKSSDVASKIKRGEVGGLFNLKGVEKIKEVQKIAVEQSRLHIPLLFGMDVIHGYETVFPIPFSLSCSWDMESIKRTAQIAAQECSADGINWTFSPMLDICRDPRWGRMAEGNGEDPYLGSCIAKAMVEGYQGQNLAAPNTVMACVKHFALYGGAEAGRDYNTVDMSHWRMFNYYMPPYKAAVDAGADLIQCGGRHPCNRQQMAAYRCAAQDVGLQGYGGNRLYCHPGNDSPRTGRPAAGFSHGTQCRYRYGHGG